MRLPVTLYSKSGSKDKWMWGLLLLSPFYTGQDPSPQNGNAHTESAVFSHHLPHSRNSLKTHTQNFIFQIIVNLVEVSVSISLSPGCTAVGTEEISTRDRSVRASRRTGVQTTYVIFHYLFREINHYKLITISILNTVYLQMIKIHVVFYIFKEIEKSTLKKI